MLKYRTERIVDESDWSEFVSQTYGRSYRFQQQDGCRNRGVFRIQVPSTYTDDFENATVPENVNDPEMGVSFAAWLSRDPKAPIADGGTQWLELWWERNFYPDIQMVANDLHARGLLEAGDYTIDIGW